jgi:hypothetical protein
LTGRHVHAAPPQPIGHGRINVLVQVKAKPFHSFARLKFRLQL